MRIKEADVNNKMNKFIKEAWPTKGIILKNRTWYNGHATEITIYCQYLFQHSSIPKSKTLRYKVLGI